MISVGANSVPVGGMSAPAPLKIESLLRPQVYGPISALSRKPSKVRQILMTAPSPGRKEGQSLPIDPDDTDDCSDFTDRKE